MDDGGYIYRNVIECPKEIVGHWAVGSVIFALFSVFVIWLLMSDEIGAKHLLGGGMCGMLLSGFLYYSHWKRTAIFRKGGGQTFDDQYIRSRYANGSLEGYLWKTKDGRRYIEVTDELL